MVYYYYYYKYIAAAVLSVVVLRLPSRRKDTTAQGIARIRHCESILEHPEERLYEDRYAHKMYSGSSVQSWMGGNRTRRIFDWCFLGGFDMLTLRTKWIDDEIMARAATTAATTVVAVPVPGTTTTSYNNNHNNNDDDYHSAEQLVILGAGYDTRGFRLDLPDLFRIVEVDQPDVQSRKRRILESIAKTDDNVYDRLYHRSSTPMVEFLEIDFNQNSIGELLSSNSNNKNNKKKNGDNSSSSSIFSLDSTKITIVTLEGVTQYIPKTSTASTLKQVHAILAPGSVLLISYVPQALFDTPSECGGGGGCLSPPPRISSLLLWGMKWIGEPWISSWSPASFRSFLSECGYEVVSDVTVAELNERYLVPKHRGLAKDKLASLERYVVASVVK